MTNIVVIGIILIVLMVFVGLLAPKTRGRQKATSFPYRRQKSLFSPAERSFLGVLDREVGGRFRVFGKVRLADVLAVESGLSASERSSAFNRISKKHLDFVLCDPSDLSVVALIELDDKSHQRSDRQERDGFLAAACAAAGLELIRFPVKTAYTPAEVRDALGRLERPSIGEQQRGTLGRGN